MTYKSNAKSVIDKLEASLIQALKQGIKESANYVLADNIERIHTRGLDVNHRLIGRYSKKPMYIAVPPFRGKTGRTTFKGVKEYRTVKNRAKGIQYRDDYDDIEFIRKLVNKRHKTQYFSLGYYEYKWRYKGFDRVRLFEKGTLMKSLILNKNNDFSYSIGFLTDEMYARADDLEIKYGKKIWGLSKYNEQKVKEVILNKINASLK